MHVRQSSLHVSSVISVLLAISLVAILTIVSVGVSTRPAGAAEIAVEDCDIIGTEGDDVLRGTSDGDVICGLGGDDTLFGAGGRDRLIGGDGDDYLVGGPGPDVLRGGAGNDSLAGGAGRDVLWGGPGNDLLRGAAGPDTLYGGPGGDIVRGGAGSDRLRGGPDGDVCVDYAVLTNAINCEHGRGGDDSPIEVSQALWSLQGSIEFVYSLSVGGGRGSVVRVDADGATTAEGNPAPTAEGLFEQAAQAIERGDSVFFDRSLGLPLQIGTIDAPQLRVGEVALRDELRVELTLAMQRWASNGGADHSYTQMRLCFCLDGRPIRVSVVGGEAEGMLLDDPEADPIVDVSTIDEHLATIGELLDGHVIDLDASFDPTAGNPTSYRADHDRKIADEEFEVRISDVEILPAIPLPGEHTPDDAPRELVIRRVGGIDVSDVIADDLLALLAAAGDDGFTLSGGGFRDPQRQIDLRRANCGSTDFAIFDLPADQCSPPTARPGRSQHELGLAIDFTSDGRLITSRTDPAFLWLTENAGTYGLMNLPSEPWHWSTTGN